MLDAPGAGLAAPQIGVGLRVFTWYVDDELGHLVNPSLDLTDGPQEGRRDACRSPESTWPAPRAYGVVAKGWNMYGDPVTVEGTMLLARAIQHETDHLDGILFIDRLDPEQRKAAHEGDPRSGVVRRPTPHRSARVRTRSRRGGGDPMRLSSPAPRKPPCRRCSGSAGVPPRGGCGADPPRRTRRPRQAHDALAGRRGCRPRPGFRFCSPPPARTRTSLAESPTCAGPVPGGRLRQRWCRRGACRCPRHGWVNLHFSLLPAWRGAAPGPARASGTATISTGASTFRLDEGLDTGPVYGTMIEAIRPTDTIR